MNNFFQNNKKDIEAGLERISRIPTSGLSGNFTIVEGLVFLDIQNNPNVISIGGGLRIPMVVVIDNNTGKIHQFALRILCPNILI